MKNIPYHDACATEVICASHCWSAMNVLCLLAMGVLRSHNDFTELDITEMGSKAMNSKAIVKL